jgi:hypothetical protein
MQEQDKRLLTLVYLCIGDDLEKGSIPLLVLDRVSRVSAVAEETIDGSSGRKQ